MNAGLKGDLRTLERKVWSRFFQDGFYEIFFGMMFAGNGLRAITDNIAFTFLVFIGILIMIFGKIYITTPRLGLVKFGKERKRKRIWVFAVILSANVLTGVLLLITLFTGYKPGPEVTAPLIGGSVLFIFILIGYLLDYWRFTFYGFFLATGIVLFEVGEDTIASIFLIASGSVLILYGAYLLFRFMKMHPLKEEG
jgi:hypothetical protein